MRSFVSDNKIIFIAFCGYKTHNIWTKCYLYTVCTFVINICLNKLDCTTFYCLLKMIHFKLKSCDRYICFHEVTCKIIYFQSTLSMQTSGAAKPILDIGSNIHWICFFRNGTRVVWQKKFWKLNKIVAKHNQEGKINSKICQGRVNWSMNLL